MKSKLTRIMGVALALTLVCSMGVAFLPANTPGGPETAEAGDLSWSTITIPTGTGNVLVGANLDLGPVAISPNFANDNTVWASVVDVTTPATPTVYKSTNGGHTWTNTTSALGAAAGDYVVDLKPSPNYAEDSTVFVVTQTNGGAVNAGRVYRSTNGGSSFGQMGVVTTVAFEVITCFDVAPTYDGTGVLAVGIADIRSGTAATAAQCVQQWGANGVLSWGGLAAGATTDVVALMYSPNFAIDTTILTVSHDIAGAIGNNPYLRAIVGGVWDGSGIVATQINGSAGAGTVDDFADSANAVAQEILRADIAVPSDYNAQVSTTRRAYITIVSQGGGGANVGNVYRVTNVTAGTDITNSTASEFSNIEYRGDFASGTLLVGLWAAAGLASDVWRTTNPTDSVVNWYGVSGGANMPSGTSGVTANTTAFIAAAVDFATSDTPTVIVGTMGNNSAFGASVDGSVSYNERGLIDNAGGALATLSDTALSPDYANDSLVFLVTENDIGGATNGNVWKRLSDGNWERCFTGTFTIAGDGVIACSNEFATDSTLYIGDRTGTAIWYSANKGQSWSARNVAAAVATTIQTVAAPDATTVYVGGNGNGNVAKSTNSGWTWPTSLTKNSNATAPVVSLKAKDSTVLVGGSGGTVRRSDDGGSTWSKISATLGVGADVYVDFDGTTVWAADGANGNVFRSEAGGGWQQLSTTKAAANQTLTDATELILAADGTLYEAAGNIGARNSDIRRSINPTAAIPVPDPTFQSMGTPGNTTAAGAVAVMDVVSGSSNIVAFIDTTAVPILRMYTDTLSAGTTGVTLVAPAEGYKAVVTAAGVSNVTFTVTLPNRVTTVTVSIANNSDFANQDATNLIAAPAVSTTQDILALGFPTEGETIYWRARASVPLNGPWSEVRTFEMPVVRTVTAPTPNYPAGDDVMNVPIKPVFNWSAFSVATGYEFQLAKDSGMTDLVVDLTGSNALGNTTSYALTSALDYDSLFYWRVRAIKGLATSYSDWSEIVGFRTMAEPAEPTPTVIVEPTPTPTPTPVPGTPAYIWAIIAIGAVLVIVVVVLIVRTRRVA